MIITNQITIEAPPETVFYWIEDPSRAMKWMTSVTQTEIINETPDMIGTTFREYVEEDGSGTEMEEEFIALKKLCERDAECH